MQITESLVRRFWAKVRKDDGCWLWTGKINATTGYGEISAGGARGKTLQAHRVSYEINIGPIPGGMQVCHTCDCHACVNPSHFFAGTQLANLGDMKAKGRAATGERNGSHTHPESYPKGADYPLASLTADEVREIRALCADKQIPQTAIAAKYGVTQATVSLVHLRKTYRSVQ